MNYNIYFSPTGGTKKVADILVCNLNGDLDPAFMQVAAENMAAKLGGHKKNYLFV